jgi:Uncharacterized protein conserved in bacteria (DUF2188)
LSKIIYTVVRHDGAWAYRANGTFSETFTTQDAARKAAKRAAREQSVPGESIPIEYEDEKGQWHHEIADGDDRPDPVVKG